ncbi:MAG: iron chelate uptake ABC transporter family permease subunit, partial [Gammaproteobacteria bacterium]
MSDAGSAPLQAAVAPRRGTLLLSRRAFVLLACITAALAAALANLALGAVQLPFATVLRILVGSYDASSAEAALAVSVVLELRAPRVLQGLLIGAALAVSGAAFQGLFRNPLADPSLIGISSGAATGAVAYIVLGGVIGGVLDDRFGGPLNALPRMAALPLAAIGGALAA